MFSARRRRPVLPVRLEQTVAFCVPLCFSLCSSSLRSSLAMKSSWRTSWISVWITTRTECTWRPVKSTCFSKCVGVGVGGCGRVGWQPFSRGQSMAVLGLESFASFSLCWSSSVCGSGLLTMKSFVLWSAGRLNTHLVWGTVCWVHLLSQLVTHSCQESSPEVMGTAVTVETSWLWLCWLMRAL